MTQLSPWWQRQPEILQHEKDWLEYLGFDARLDEQLLADANVVRFHASQTVGDQHVEFDIVYPDLYPYFKVEITTEQEFANHHHPFEKLLCLLRGGSASWDLNETAAQMIAVQLPKVLDDQPGGTGDPHSDGHAEPRSNYFTYAKSSVVRIDGSFQLPGEHGHGTLVVGCDNPFSPEGLRGSLLKVRGAAGTTLWNADPSVTRMYADPWQVEGRWTRMPGPPIQDGAEAALLAAQDACPGFTANGFHQIGDTELEVTGLVFPEEVLPDTIGDGWMFVVRHRTTGPAVPQPGRGRRGGRVTPKATAHITGHLVQGHRSGQADVRHTAAAPAAARSTSSSTARASTSVEPWISLRRALASKPTASGRRTLDRVPQSREPSRTHASTTTSTRASSSSGREPQPAQSAT